MLCVYVYCVYIYLYSIYIIITIQKCIRYTYIYIYIYIIHAETNCVRFTTGSYIIWKYIARGVYAQKNIRRLFGHVWSDIIIL